MHCLGAGQFLSSQVLTENGGAKAMSVVTFALGFIVVVEELAVAFKVLAVETKMLVLVAFKELAADVKVLAVSIEELAVDVKVLAVETKMLVLVAFKELAVDVKVLAIDDKELAVDVGILLVVIIDESVALIVSDAVIASMVVAGTSVDVNEA
jgi:hypothetical protein